MSKKAARRIARINAQPFTVIFADGTMHHYSSPNKKGKRKITIKEVSPNVDSRAH